MQFGSLLLWGITSQGAAFGDDVPISRCPADPVPFSGKWPRSVSELACTAWSHRHKLICCCCLSSEQAPRSAVWALLLNSSANYRTATQIPGQRNLDHLGIGPSCGPLETPNLPHFCICGRQNRRQISVPAVSVPGPSLGWDWLPCGLPPKARQISSQLGHFLWFLQLSSSCVVVTSGPCPLQPRGL